MENEKWMLLLHIKKEKKREITIPNNNNSRSVYGVRYYLYNTYHNKLKRRTLHIHKILLILCGKKVHVAHIYICFVLFSTVQIYALYLLLLPPYLKFILLLLTENIVNVWEIATSKCEWIERYDNYGNVAYRM